MRMTEPLGQRAPQHPDTQQLGSNAERENRGSDLKWLPFHTRHLQGKVELCSAHLKAEMRRAVGLLSRSRRTCATLHTAQAKATGSSHAPLSLKARFAPESPRSGM